MPLDATEIKIGPGEHVVQFYEHDSEVVGTVAPYLVSALRGTGVAVVIAVEVRRRAFESALEGAGLDLAELARQGRYIALDAAHTLSQFLEDGRVDRERFDAVVGVTVRRAAGAGWPLHVYGEMVGILWEAGEVPTAIELELLWNDLAQETTFSLLCAYQGEYVSGSDHSDALGGFCHLHSAVLHQGGTETSRRFRPEPRAPRAARRYLVELLRRWGHDEAVVQQAALVLSELATNAVLHARTRFTVTVRSVGVEVHVVVGDDSPVLPVLGRADERAEPGRGLVLVDALAQRWGAEPAGDGKVVWAVLRS